MPTSSDDSFADNLQPFFSNKDKMKRAIDDVRHAVAPLVGPDQAKVLTAVALDVATGIQQRNDRADVHEACAALRQALDSVDAIEGNLDG